MGHYIFVALHVVALVSVPILLLVTIPAHLIYGATWNTRNRGAPRPDTHVMCPDCKELILKDARVCKHCGCKLVPRQ